MSTQIHSGLLHREPPIFDLSSPGRTGHALPAPENLDCEGLPTSFLRDRPPLLPELSEVEVVRHFVRLSQWNHCIELGMYPLGSCTMKYNPKVNDAMSALPGFTAAHPLQEDEFVQGSLELMYQLEGALSRVSGFHSVTLQPSAGANGEFTGLALIKKAIDLRGEGARRKKVLIPDTAHGTNPASVVLNGFEPVSIITGPEGVLLPDAVRPHLNDELAAIMVTNPNTLGIFESHLKEIAELVHGAGGYVYMDGANFNAIMGKVRPADLGVDTMHFNLHKTFATPHGGGGPGAGPVGCTEELAPYLPVPRVLRTNEGRYRLVTELPNSIGRVHPFFGNFSILVRAFTYIMENGGAGLKKVTEMAVLNANYVRALLKDTLTVSVDVDTLHEVVFTDRELKKETHVSTMDVAKRLLDFGFHPPTVYFPLIVPGAFMVEPTETESRIEIDHFVETVKTIIEEARTEPEKVTGAPYRTGVGRLDETTAARKRILRWTPTQP